MNVMRNIPADALSDVHRSAPRQGGSMPAVLELLKPITWFAPMWAFGCGVVSSGAGVGRVGGGRPGRAAWPARSSAAPARRSTTGTTATSMRSTSRTGRSPRAGVPGRRGLYIAIAWTTLSLLVATALGPLGLRGRRGGLALAWAYSAPPLRLKRNGWWGNTACAACYEGLPWITGAAVMPPPQPAWRVVSWPRAVQRRRTRHHDAQRLQVGRGRPRTGIGSLPVRWGRARRGWPGWSCRRSSWSAC